MKADGSTATQLINQRQIDQIGLYIYDPGMGTLPADTEFMGWSSQEDYSAETDRMTISDIREEVKVIIICQPASKPGHMNERYHLQCLTPAAVQFL